MRLRSPSKHPSLGSDEMLAHRIALVCQSKFQTPQHQIHGNAQRRSHRSSYLLSAVCTSHCAIHCNGQPCGLCFANPPTFTQSIGHHSTRQHLAPPPFQSLPTKIGWKETYFQLDICVNYVPTTPWFPAHRHLT